MKKRLLTVFGLFLLAAAQASHAAIDECVNANPASVDDVQRCISRLPEVASAQGAPNAYANGCQSAKYSIANAKGNRGQTAHNEIPSCTVIGDALHRLNGKYPVWYPCVDYDGTQQKLNKCLPAFFPSVYYYHQKKEVQCQQLRGTMVQALPSITDVPQGARAALSCEMINQALIANGWMMTASDCLNYRPDDPAHIERCLHHSVSHMRNSGQAKPDCEGGRRLYQQQLQTANSTQPGSYVVPSCAMMDPVIARIYAGESQPTAAATPAPQSVPAPQPTPSQPAAQPPAVATSMPAPIPNNLPAPAAVPAADPYAQQQPAAQPAAAQPQAKQSEKIQKVNEGLDTARQVMDIFKGFGKQ